MAVIQKEINVIQGFGERQILRDTAAVVPMGSVVYVTSDDAFALGADDVSGVVCIAQNNSANADSLGTASDFVGATAKVIGIPVNSGAEVQIPAGRLGDDYAVVIGAAVYASANGKIDDAADDGDSVVIGYVTGGDLTDGPTVLLG